MRPEELMQLLRRRPFIPVRIHISGGTTYDVRHPDSVLVLRGRVDIGVGADPVSGVLDSVQAVALIHIIRVEDLAPGPAIDLGATPASGGNGA
jgi:hypothetical protein